MPVVDGSVPDAGDVLWIDFGSPVGREQGGRRPALVLTPQAYNRRSSIMLVNPITRTQRPWPFQVALPAVGSVTGYVLVDQVRVVDPAARRMKRAGSVAPATFEAVRRMLAALLGIPVSN